MSKLSFSRSTVFPNPVPHATGEADFYPWNKTFLWLREWVFLRVCIIYRFFPDLYSSPATGDYLSFGFKAMIVSSNLTWSLPLPVQPCIWRRHSLFRRFRQAFCYNGSCYGSAPKGICLRIKPCLYEREHSFFNKLFFKSSI